MLLSFQASYSVTVRMQGPLRDLPLQQHSVWPACYRHRQAHPQETQKPYRHLTRALLLHLLYLSAQ